MTCTHEPDQHKLTGAHAHRYACPYCVVERLRANLDDTIITAKRREERLRAALEQIAMYGEPDHTVGDTYAAYFEQIRSVAREAITATVATPGATVRGEASDNQPTEASRPPGLLCNGLCHDAVADVDCPVHGIHAWLRSNRER